MTFAAWRVAFMAEVYGAAKRTAQLWNLENEYRLPNVVLDQFRDRIVAYHTAAAPAPDAATRALDAAVNETRAPGNPWLMQLRYQGGHAMPERVVTHMEESAALKRYHGSALRPGRGPRTIKLNAPLGAEKDAAGNWRVQTPFLWVTWAPYAGPGLPNDPTTVKRELGLAHYHTGVRVLRIPLAVNPDNNDHSLFAPSCLDARLYEAWAPPPRGCDWGMTRDLVDGMPRWPEIIVRTESQLHVTEPVGTVVSPGPGGPDKIQPLAVDFMAGR